VNGDGFDDLFVPGANPNAPPYRSLRVYAGGPGGYSQVPALIVVAEDTRQEPLPASRAGDVNGDGAGDLILASPEYAVGGSPVGRAYVLHGRSDLLAEATHSAPSPPRGTPARRGDTGD
jgi:hypothetical protein